MAPQSTADRVTSPRTSLSGEVAPLRTSREHAQIRFKSVRDVSEQICAPLETEDYVVQTMPDVSPPKWHLAHTTWFFETFLLKTHLRGYREFDPRFAFLFNSYYEALGERHPRRQRGLLSRPTVRQVYEYRRHVDRFVPGLIESLSDSDWEGLAPLLTLGLHHEQQHQELLLTDLKHILLNNERLDPVYAARPPAPVDRAADLEWIPRADGVYETGYAGAGFCYDNEMPRHRSYLQGHALASRLVTNGEYLEFMNASGYRSPGHWLSDGWDAVREQGWTSPLYWRHEEGRWWELTLGGKRPLAEDEPVSHVSYYEADAYARWRGCRLPTEEEWEIAARDEPVSGNFYDDGFLHPRPARGAPGTLTQLYGDVWEWTQSPYTAYPGFAPAEGAVGEYNGKFMCNQFVLRGGSCVTSRDHIRPTYRNFFHPQSRWQFSGIRLAKDA